QAEGSWSLPEVSGIASAQRVEVDILLSDLLPLQPAPARRITIHELTLEDLSWDPEVLAEGLEDVFAHGPVRIQQAILWVSQEGLEIETLTFSHPWILGQLTGRLAGMPSDLH